MSYYQGDFYRGDPGWGWLKKIAGIATSFIPGVGAAKPIIYGAVGAGKMARATSAMRKVGGLVKGHPVLSAAGAAGAVGTVAAMGGAAGAMRRRVDPATGAPVFRKRRHMRVTNVKALRRSLRRVHGFARIAKKVIHIASPGRGKTHFKFKRRRKTV